MILISLMAFALFMLFYISITLYRNSLYFKPIHDFEESVNQHSDKPLVSILIPARNEEFNINNCVRSALNQTYDAIEVIVLDDESTDKTPQILKAIQELNPKLNILTGKPKPSDWLGKNWACNQLSEAANGSILLFIDADVTLEPHVINAMVERFNQNEQIGLITAWPQQTLVTFWEHVLVPMVYYALLGFLYLRYTEKPPHWLPSAIRKRVAPTFAAACGQFLAFRKETYQSINGHYSVKQEVVEDVELAKQVISQGKSVLNVSGKDAIYCRMYRSKHEIKQGFRKNFLAGFQYSIPFFLLAGLMHTITFILPFALLFFYLSQSFWFGAILAYCLIIFPIFHRMWLHLLFDWKLRFIIYHVLGVIWFHKLAFTVLLDHFFKRKTSWKGRSIT